MQRHHRKGQSAIEYLMTYGWMLLVVAIVGGAIFATVQGQCAQQATGFTGESVTVETFEPTDSNLQIVFRNGANEQINITKVNVTDDGSEVDSETNIGTSLNVGDSTTITMSGITSSDQCNTYDVEVTFDKGSITGAVASGTMSGNFA